MARLTPLSRGRCHARQRGLEPTGRHRALLVSGLSVLTSATWLLRRDLNGESAEAA